MTDRSRCFGVFLLAALATASGALAPRAGATLVYERGESSIVAAEDDGRQPRVVGHGSGPVVSGDGALVAFAVQSDFTLERDTWVVRSDGALPPRRVARNMQPVGLSPDGRTVLTVRVSPNTGQDGATLAVPVAGGAPVTLTRGSSSLVAVDGTTATLLTGEIRGRRSRVVEIPLSGGRALTRVTGIDGGAVRSRSGRLAFARTSRRSGADEVRLTRPVRSLAPSMPGTGPGLLRNPVAWTPDGRALIATETRFTESSLRFRTIAVKLDVGSGRRRVLVRDVEDAYGLSPDGRSLLVERRSRKTGVSRLLLVSLNAGPTRVLARDAENAAFSQPGP